MAPNSYPYFHQIQTDWQLRFTGTRVWCQAFLTHAVVTLTMKLMYKKNAGNTLATNHIIRNKTGRLQSQQNSNNNNELPECA